MFTALRRLAARMRGPVTPALDLRTLQPATFVCSCRTCDACLDRRVAQAIRVVAVASVAMASAREPLLPACGHGCCLPDACRLDRPSLDDLPMTLGQRTRVQVLRLAS